MDPATWHFSHTVGAVHTVGFPSLVLCCDSDDSGALPNQAPVMVGM